ncbi:MAG: rhodanese-like domain-containing protein [Pyrinomonadaceae bacterium]
MKCLLITLIASAFIVGCQPDTTKKTDSGVPDIGSPIKEVTPDEAESAVAKAYSQFVDVRTSGEYAGGHASRAINIPLDSLGTSLDKLEKNEPVYLICETGNRSKKAAVILKEAGFNNVINVSGGTQAWKAANLPIETKAPHAPPG